MVFSGPRSSWIAVRCRTAISTLSRLMSRVGGKPVMRGPTLIFDADELLAFLAQARQGGAHTVHLPARCRGQIADRGAVWPFEQRHNRRSFRWPYWQGGRVHLRR